MIGGRRFVHFWLAIGLIALLPFHGALAGISPLSLGRYWKQVLLLLLVFSAFLVGFAKGKLSRAICTKYSVLLLLFCVVVLASAVANSAKGYNLFSIWHYAGYMVYYFVLVAAVPRSAVVKAFKLLVAVGVVTAILGMIQVFDLDIMGIVNWEMINPRGTIDGVPVRIGSTVGGTVSFGLYLAMLLPLAVTLGFCARTGRRATLFLSASVVVATALLLTYTRNAWLLAGTAVVSVFAMLLRGQQVPVKRQVRAKAPRVLLVIMLAALGLSMIAAFPGGTLLSSRELLVDRLCSVFDWSTDPGNVGRLEAWTAVLTVLNPRVVLLGLGPGEASSNTREYAEVTEYSRMTGRRSTESFYLQLLVEVGIIGAVLFIAIISSFIHLGIKIWTLSGEHTESCLALGVSCSLLGLMASLVFMQGMNLYIVSALTWTYCALLAVLAYGSRRTEA